MNFHQNLVDLVSLASCMLAWQNINFAEKLQTELHVILRLHSIFLERTAKNYDNCTPTNGQFTRPYLTDTMISQRKRGGEICARPYLPRMTALLGYINLDIEDPVLLELMPKDSQKYRYKPLHIIL